MTISQETTIQAYQLKRGGTYARMAVLRMIAADSKRNRNPDTRLAQGDWRGARSYKLNTYEAAYGVGLSCGFEAWYSFAPQFRNETDAHEFSTKIHRGWYGDTENQESLHIGFVACLPHGRFLAGYRLEDTDERTYFPQIFTCEFEAAKTADEHARVAAEREDEYQQRQNEAMRIDALLEAKEAGLREAHEDLRMAIAATRGSEGLRHLQAKKMQGEALARAKSIVAKIRNLRAEREALDVET